MKFVIEGMPEYKMNLWHVIGRCGSDIQINNTFTCIVPYKATVTENDVLVTYGEKISICLKIEKIFAYGRELDEWSKGMTALLVLSGDGNKLDNDMVLLSEPESLLI
ncbi:hypothetical protein [Budvicia aquatica]|uniref:hypothetical protein n=1 Tax=Budvicia aquatica TaxID=82979 RepID=UPI0020840AF0|nr:hypothetical protein [Budvicia aquatica]GKX53152.1 hypothetical protein SOASR029_34610 [Budvicia aquatica]